MVDSLRLHRYVPGQPHWWQWLTVLSFDAPLVAVAWQLAFARVAAVTLNHYQPFILGAGVWLAYAIDRWIEGWRLNKTQLRTQRHWFYQRWRWPIAGAWAAVLAVTLGLSFTQLTPAELGTGLILLGPVLLYLLSHQFLHRKHRWRAPKEICVALLFTAGVGSFPAAGQPAVLKAVAGPLALFCLLCFADCALISLWEDEVDRTHDQTSFTLQYPRGRRYVRALPWLVAALGIALAVTERPAATSGITACAAGSGVLLGSLDLAHRRLGRQLSRALVDLTLLTPFAFLFWFHSPPR